MTARDGQAAYEAAREGRPTTVLVSFPLDDLEAALDLAMEATNQEAIDGLQEAIDWIAV